MTRDQLKEEISKAIDNEIDENREVTDEDLVTVSDAVTDFIENVDIEDDDEADAEQPTA